MALNPVVYTDKIVRSFLRYQLTAYPFADDRLHGQMRKLLQAGRLPVLCNHQVLTTVFDAPDY
jgi:hypothetical protein